jgi:hypothetical protein
MPDNEQRNAVVPYEPPPKITATSAYGTLGIMRGHEVTMRWEGAKLGMYFNIPGFATVASLLVANTTRSTFILISVGAFVFAFLNEYLYKSIRRSGKHFKLWNAKMLELEQKCGIEGGVQIFTSKEYSKLQKDRLKIQDLLLVVTRICIVMWGATCLMAFGAALFGGPK